MDFTAAEKETLINFARDHPPLYNQQHPKYKDRELKNRLWATIGETLGKNGNLY